MAKKDGECVAVPVSEDAVIVVTPPTDADDDKEE